ncbi:MAG: NUDIX hydrolase [Mycobacterium sp.]|nr:NUDIX hydrolase [Mycobacterium sp.]
MRGDGDGWVVSEFGTYHWGVHGAAGLLLRAPLSTGRPAVLLQHRAPWSHQGGTWALPGGAMDFGETPWEAALREAHEEAGLAEDHITYRATVVTAEVSAVGGGTWTYSTVVADAPEPLFTVANRESVELRWVPEDDVTDLPLHPAFEKSWPVLCISDHVPAHECVERPHTVVIEKAFHWCGAATTFSPARP